MVGHSSSEDLISSLDLGNPLYLQNSNFSSNTFISVKLTSTENYRVWAAAMKLAINTRNKTEFIGVTCVKSAYANSAPLSNQSSLSYRENLPYVKDAFAIVTKENLTEALLLLLHLSLNLSYNKNLGPKQNGFKSINANTASTSNENGTSFSFTNEQMKKLMKLINEVPSRNMQANMAANQHMTISTVNMFGIIDISNLNLTVGHPNGTLAKIKYIGNLKLSENVVFFDVLVVLEYCVSLLSVNKLIKDSHMLGHPSDQVVDVLQDDLNSLKTLKTVWVYLVKTKDEVYDLFVSFVNLILNQFNCSIKTVRSDNGTKFVNNKMHSLFNSLGIVHQTTYAYNPHQNGIAERKHMHLLPSSVLNGKSSFELVPDDDGRGSATPNDDGNDHPRTRNSNTSDDSEDDFATSMGDISNSEGNVPTSSGLDTQRILLENSSQVQPDLRKFSRSVKMRAKFNDYVVGSSRNPVVKMSTVRCILNVDVCNNWDLFQLDINNAFLYGDLSEDVYMTLPPSFDNEKSKVLVLFNLNLTILCLLREIEKFKLFLKSKFQIKDLGKLKYFLGIEVLDNKDGICLSQRKYFLKLLHEYGMLAAKHIDTPLPENTTLNHVESDDDHLLSNVGNYQRLVGKLIYLTNTRHGISYVVHCLSQFMHAPLESYLDAALRVLRYLKGSPGRGFQISEHVKKQSTLSMSYAEAEYKSMASASCEVIWLSNLLSDMGVKGLLHVVMYYDNSLFAVDNEQHFVLCDKLGPLDMFQVEKLERGSLGWHLEEIHVTWAQLEKKRTRLRLYTKSFEETVHTESGDGVAITKRRCQDFHIDDVRDLMTALELIMEYLVKISKKACILELKRRNMKITGTGYSLKDKNEAKPDKTEHGFEKSAKNRGQSSNRVGNVCFSFVVLALNVS
ncbi:ribonuclease H-like domain-containing protein [Tanacetum coccineum]